MLLALILISSEIFTPKSSEIVGVNDSKAWDPRPLTSACQADKLKSKRATIKECALLCLSADRHVAFHA